MRACTRYQWIWMDWIWLEWIELLIGLDPTLVELLARQWLYQIWKSTGLRQSSLTSDWSNLLHHLLARIPPYMWTAPCDFSLFQ